MLNIDYANTITQQPNIAETAFNGLKQGLAIGDTYNEYQQKQLERQQTAEANQKAVALLSNPKATAQDYDVLVAMNPYLSKNIADKITKMGEDKANSAYANLFGVHNSLRVGDIEGAKAILEQQAKAYDAQDMKDEAMAARAKIKAIDYDSTQVMNSTGTTLSMMDLAQGKDRFNKYLQNLATLNEKQASAANKAAETANIPIKNAQEAQKIQTEIDKLRLEEQKALNDQEKDSINQQIEQKKIELEQLKYNADRQDQAFKESELPPQVIAQTMKISEDNQKAQNTILKVDDALNEIKNLNYDQFGGIATATWGNVVKAFPVLDEKRYRYETLVREQIIPMALSLLAGTGQIAAKEMEMAVSTLRNENAPVEAVIQAFNDIKRVNSQILTANTFRQEWLEKTRGRSVLNQDMEIGGKILRKGTNINDAITDLTSIGGKANKSKASSFMDTYGTNNKSTGTNGTW